ncbi:alpha/beta hydrolase [Rhodococcus sp. TAF43]|uniref:alpha/beta fold hydrolase n=1 Tax=unclassified Rhodococcus (in: high G+C Gram-positive bacteria) TaxID=192944 RepID=UPI001583328B|nr:alpha/beta hydrolase [Rhodococcus sp. W8901]QKT13425.1 alpha/beta hydrolase [Rhodococcus sp. W8901]
MTDPVSAHSHRSVRVGDIDMHIAEQGEGPPVVLCHGFPGLWYSWRHQLPALAAAGYRVIAPDMRGYGRTDAPSDPRSYDRRHTVDDMVGLLDALGIEDAVFAGHDFGAQLVWDLPTWAPGRVRALMQLSVPRMPRQPIQPTIGFRYLASQHFVHLHYFQERGPADRELGDNPKAFLAKIFHALSGANRYLDCWDFPSEGNGYLDVLPEPPVLPWSWLGEDEFDYYVREFTRTGFTGGLNWYRADDYVWEQNEELHDRPITVPVTFVAGAKDPVLEMMGKDPFETMSRMVPGLVSTHVIPDVGHFVQMEAPERVNAAMLEFLAGLD